jgi:hypothetical protein
MRKSQGIDKHWQTVVAVRKEIRPLPALVNGMALLFFMFNIVSGTATGQTVAPLPLRDKVTTKLELQATNVPGLLLHVAVVGDDKGLGTKKKPFGSLERARDEIRTIRQKGALPRGGVMVLIHGGKYDVSGTFDLTAEDSGNEGEPVRYCAVPGEKVIFSGGVRLSGWKQLNDPKMYQLLPLKSVGKVWFLDMKSNGITDPIPLKTTSGAHELIFNNKVMQLSRGPNEGFLHVADVLVKDKTHGDGAYDTRLSSSQGIFTYKEDIPNKWVAEPDLLLYGYWFWGWSEAYLRVAGIDTVKRLITLAKPWNAYGFSIDDPFYAYNALSELDAPGEWYMDRVNGRILFYPPSDLMKATVELSTFASVMVKMENVSNVRFEGLTWESGSADGILIQDGANCLFAGCTLRHFAGNAINVKGGLNHGFVSCDIYSLGCGGILISGGDRKTLSPCRHFVENCDIYNLSRNVHTYSPCVLMSGVGISVRHNRMHENLSTAIRVDGNDHLVEYNEIYDVVTESDDQGGIDMWNNPTYRGNVFRYNYWHHIGNWRGTGIIPRCGQSAIRVDDGICGTLVQGNIFEKCSQGTIIGFGALQINGGKDNIIENNIFADCMAMISIDLWGEKRWQNYSGTALDNKGIDKELYLHRYPELATLTEDAGRNHIRNNRSIRCDQSIRVHYGAVLTNPDTTNNIALPPQTMLTMKSDNSLFRQSGFKRIPVEEMGIYIDAWRKLK